MIPDSKAERKKKKAPGSVETWNASASRLIGCEKISSIFHAAKIKILSEGRKEKEADQEAGVMWWWRCHVSLGFRLTRFVTFREVNRR
jgi:hypothetical protein